MSVVRREDEHAAQYCSGDCSPLPKVFFREHQNFSG
jgi:hypothetical protein